MFQKSHHAAGVTTIDSLMRASNTNQSGTEQSFTRARKLAAARASRENNGGMFSRSRLYRAN